MATRDERLADARATARLAVLAAALGGDSGAVYHFLAGLLGEGVSLEEILFDILAPLEAEVGRRWHQGDLGISEEHLVTATLETVVSLLAGSFDVPADAPRLVVACPEGEVHSLPARMAWAYLVFLGWRAVFLGPGYPAADLGSFLRAQRPSALLLSCTMVTALPGARAAISAAHAAAIPVLAGGAAFGPDDSRARALGADAWAADPTGIEPILESWQPDPAAAEAAAHSAGLESDLLADRRSAVVAAALAGIMNGSAPQPDTIGAPEIGAHLEALFDAVSAAVLLDDPAVLDGFAAWQRDRLQVIGAGDLSGYLVSALTEALDGRPEAATRMLAAATG